MSDSQSGSEDESVGGGGRSSHDNPLAVLQDKLKELNTAYELVLKNSHQLSKLAAELESKGNSDGGKPKEKFALLKITSSAIVKVSLLKSVFEQPRNIFSFS